jgi:hypothetical protein
VTILGPRAIVRARCGGSVLVHRSLRGAEAARQQRGCGMVRWWGIAGLEVVGVSDVSW